jgi:NAD(P)-dependent dehydrogenase (short-subunit alcohol dehydrogenase family)
MIYPSESAATKRLHGKVAIVTGAGGSGLGAATARLFAAEGARVAVVDADAGHAKLTVDAIQTGSGTARAFEADVADLKAANAAVGQILAAWGQIDILVANCGIFRAGNGLTTTDHNWDLQFRVNVKGAFVWTRAVLPFMIEKQSGVIITLGSQLAHNYDTNAVAYAATKGAVVSMTRALAIDHGPQGIRATCLVPAVIDTDASRATLRARFPNDFDAAQGRRREKHALKRLGEPIEVARAALFLATDATFTTGTTLFVDGGWTVM